MFSLHDNHDQLLNVHHTDCAITHPTLEGSAPCLEGFCSVCPLHVAVNLNTIHDTFFSHCCWVEAQIDIKFCQ